MNGGNIIGLHKEIKVHCDFSRKGLHRGIVSRPECRQELMTSSHLLMIVHIIRERERERERERITFIHICICLWCICIVFCGLLLVLYCYF